jgi:16S rRNA (guanine527-N7)-methyltransferase
MNAEVIYKVFPQLSQTQKRQFEMLGPLYKDWNSKINVISRKDMDCFYTHHVLHSLAVAMFMKEFLPDLKKDISIMDVGCGGGFPGIPMAILYPEAKFLLVDSIGKKVKVAQAVADEIGLANVTTLHQRAEDVDIKADLIISRAVTSLANFIPWVKGKYKEGIIYLKGGNLDEEIDEAQKKCKIRPSQIFQKDISDWFTDDYFSEKKILYLTR